jgi:hypothetical protein
MVGSLTQILRSARKKTTTTTAMGIVMVRTLTTPTAGGFATIGIATTLEK